MRKLLAMAGTVAGVALTMGVTTGAPAQAHDGTPCDTSADACLDLSSGQAWLMDNGKVTYGPTEMSSGTDSQETPTGSFAVQYKDRDHWSKEYDAPMPYSVFFTDRGHAIHHGDVNEESNGCVRLSEGPAKTFYSELEPGETVQIVP